MKKRKTVKQASGGGGSGSVPGSGHGVRDLFARRCVRGTWRSGPATKRGDTGGTRLSTMSLVGLANTFETHALATPSLHSAAAQGGVQRDMCRGTGLWDPTVHLQGGAAVSCPSSIAWIWASRS